MKFLKEWRELEDLIRGATILGTGGGGDPEEGLRLLKTGLTKAGGIRIADLNELSEDSVIVVPYLVGTMAPTAKTKKAVKVQDPIRVAFDEMRKLLAKEISAVAPTELGGFNTAVALYMGCELDIPIVDGDLLGRAAPELHQCTVHIFGIPMYPSVLVSETGNKIVIKEYSDIDDYEALARYASMLSGRFVAVVDTPLTIQDANKAIVKGTLSLCLNLGRAVRKARDSGKDPVEAARAILNGWRVFRGVVREFKWRDERGFMTGEVNLEGSGLWGQRTFRSWIMNEHIMAWLDERPVIMPPDLIMFVDEQGEGIVNSKLKVGMKVNVLAAKAPEVWRTPEGLRLFGPRRFGFEYDYMPLERSLGPKSFEPTRNKPS